MIQSIQERHDSTHAQSEIAFQRLKSQLHEELVDSLDLASINETHLPEVRKKLQSVAKRLVERRVDSSHRPRMLHDMQDELFGLGPLESIMEDSSVHDILIHGPHDVFVKVGGKLTRSPVVFADQQHLSRIVQRIMSRVGQPLDEANPMVDARLPDGSRVRAIFPSLAIHGPLVSIHRFADQRLRLDAITKNGSLSRPMADFLLAAVAARVSCLISGAAGAGKTTLLNAISAAIPPDECLVTIEDSAELQLQHPHVTQLETRPAISEVIREITLRDLVKAGLRLRPDRILLSEVRGAEAFDMLQAMNTGQEGSMTTIHAHDTRDALSRLEMMVALTGVELPIAVVQRYIASGVKLLIHLACLKGGVRKVVRITELMRAHDGNYISQDLFTFHMVGLDENGLALGEFKPTGNTPTFVDRFSDVGVRWNSDWFRSG